MIFFFLPRIIQDTRHIVQIRESLHVEFIVPSVPEILLE